MTRITMTTATFLSALMVISATALADPKTKTETFDRDPGWEGHNNRPKHKPQTVRQDFGYSADTSHAGGKAKGEMGGFIASAAEPAYYAKALGGTKTFDDKLTASGTMSVGNGGQHLLIGFFNNQTINEWRTPNAISIRLLGRGNDVFFAFVEYATSKWRAGGDNPKAFPTTKDAEGRDLLIGFPSKDKTFSWSITYDPKGNNGGGAVTATIGEHTAICNLDPGHKSDGATFTHFGLLNVMKGADTGGDVWLDDVSVNGAPAESFDADPKWDAKGNRRTYETMNVRPWFDFGYTDTNFAGGKSKGEMGGLIFRGDSRFPERMACYGDKLGPLTLDKPFMASGKIAMTRGVTDTTTLFGFYNREQSMRSNPEHHTQIPESLIGVQVEGPSGEGFYFYPVYRTLGGTGDFARQRPLPYIYPNGGSRDWKLAYDPAGAAGKGQITVSLDGQTATRDLKEGEKSSNTKLDRFGIITTWHDGNSQNVYFDDLTYTVQQ